MLHGVGQVAAMAECVLDGVGQGAAITVGVWECVLGRVQL